MRRTEFYCLLLSILLDWSKLVYGQATTQCGRDDNQDSDFPYKMTSFTHINADDVIFTDDVIFEVSAASKKDCALACANHEKCVTFTFSPVTSTCHCYGNLNVLKATSLFFEARARSYTNTKALLCSRAGDGYSWQAGRCIRAYNQRVPYDKASQTCLQNGGGHLIHVKTPGDVELVNCVFMDMALLCSRAGDGYAWQAGRCIRAYNQRVPYDKASQTCLQNGGGHLIHVKTPGDVELVNCVFMDMGWTSYSWVGADDRQVEGDFRWSDGTPLPLAPLHSPFWLPNQPDNAKSVSETENCVVINVNGMLNDQLCVGSSIVYICQLDI